MKIKYSILNGEIKHKFCLVQGDITEETTDVIVNAANENLILGAGVAGAIRRKGGPIIQKECNKIGGCKIGGAVITKGGNLKAKYVIHAVGPIYHQYKAEQANELLAEAIKNSLQLTIKHNLLSITFPAISTGIYGFPKRKAADIIVFTIVEYLKSTEKPINVQICLFSEEDFQIFNKAAQRILTV